MVNWDEGVELDNKADFLYQTTACHVLIVMHMMVDSGLVIVGFITMVYVILVTTLLVYVKYEWCDLLFKNNMVFIYLDNFRPGKINQNITIMENKLGLSCAKLRLNWASMLRLPLNKNFIKKLKTV